MAQLLTREPPNGTKYYYVYGAGQLLYEISEGGSAPTGLIYYHFDHNGNTIALSNSTEQVVQRNEYSPYGQLTQASANYDTPFLFAGAFGVQTSGDGLLYMRARFYNPRMGRFLNADPIGFGGGSNWYAYCGGANPISYADPSGLLDGGSSNTLMGSQYNTPGFIAYVRSMPVIPSNPNPRFDAIMTGSQTMLTGGTEVVAGYGFATTAPLTFGAGAVGVIAIADGVPRFGLGFTSFMAGVTGNLPRTPIPQSVGEIITAASGSKLAGDLYELGITVTTSAGDLKGLTNIKEMQELVLRAKAGDMSAMKDLKEKIESVKETAEGINEARKDLTGSEAHPGK